MKLAEVFAAFGELAGGTSDRAAVAARLYEDPSCEDARRLLVYDANIQHARQTMLDRNYPLTRAAILRAGGPSLWSDVTRSYFRAHPPRGFRYVECAKAFPSFLTTPLVRERTPALPSWIAELADVELWQTLTRIDPREDDDPAAGSLRLACTVEIREYRFAIASWIQRGTLPDGAPPERSTLVVFFRDRAGASRRAIIGAAEVAVIAAVEARRALPVADRTLHARLERALRALLEAGVILGTERAS